MCLVESASTQPWEVFSSWPDHSLCLSLWPTEQVDRQENVSACLFFTQMRDTWRIELTWWCFIVAVVCNSHIKGDEVITWSRERERERQMKWSVRVYHTLLDVRDRYADLEDQQRTRQRYCLYLYTRVCLGQCDYVQDRIDARRWGRGQWWIYHRAIITGTKTSNKSITITRGISESMSVVI